VKAAPSRIHSEYLELADWRRRVAEMWAEWRGAAAGDSAAATATFRAAKDELLRDHPQSPLPESERESFRGLGYWAYDPAWRMTVRLEPDPGDSGPESEAGAGAGAPGVAEQIGLPPAQSGFAPINLPSSTSESFSFRRIGSVALKGPLDGQRLSVFWMAGYAGGLFLPFRDATSGHATYGAGRYLLDTIKSADHGGDWRDGTLVLDLNMAFHPSCAYDPRWSCPLAPPENRLAVPVEVGERLAM
jgi:uncharacterized protein (DUF1684 family)